MDIAAFVFSAPALRAFEVRVASEGSAVSAVGLDLELQALFQTLSALEHQLAP